jgi:hypothetical protein
LMGYRPILRSDRIRHHKWSGGQENMKESNEHIETIGKIWDSLSTGGRIRFIGYLLGILFAATGASFYLGGWRADARIAALEAKYERDLTDRDEGRLSQIKDLRHQLSMHLWSKESGCPDFVNAEPLPTSQESLLKEYLKERNDEKTSVQMSDFFDKYANRAVHWEGFVWDVVDEGHMMRVTMAFPQYKCPQTLLVNCYFTKELVYPKNHWCRGNWMAIQGVLNRCGEVVKCSVMGEGSGVSAKQLRVIAPSEVPLIPAPR